MVLHRMFRQPVGLEPDWTFTQESDRYSEADHRTWISLYDRPAEIVSRRACNAFLNGLDALDLHGQRVPDFDHGALWRCRGSCPTRFTSTISPIGVSPPQISFAAPTSSIIRRSRTFFTMSSAMYLF